MEILLIGSDRIDQYPGVFCKNFRSALKRAKIDYDFQPLGKNFCPRPGYDVYIGAGDELFRRMPQTVSDIKALGGTVVDIRTKKLPSKPKTVIGSFFQNKKYQADFILTHMQDRRSKCFYIGQGVNEKSLYSEHDDTFTILVDHWMPKRSSKVQRILNECKLLSDKNKDVRVWYHNSDGIVENVFTEDCMQYKIIDFDELTSYYRKTHVFLPTHRETQGIVGAEIGMCGGITYLEKWMYPKKIISKIPHKIYSGSLKWPDKIDIDGNIAFTKKHYGLDSYAERIKNALQEIASNIQ